MKKVIFSAVALMAFSALTMAGNHKKVKIQTKKTKVVVFDCRADALQAYNDAYSYWKGQGYGHEYCSNKGGNAFLGIMAYCGSPEQKAIYNLD